MSGDPAPAADAVLAYPQDPLRAADQMREATERLRTELGSVIVLEPAPVVELQ